MAAYEIPNLRFSGVSGAAIARRRFVTLNSSEQVVQATNGGVVIGVSSQDCSGSGKVAEVYDGIVIVEAGGAITPGTKVQSDANGKAVVYASGEVAGRAMTAAGAAGDVDDHR